MSVSWGSICKVLYATTAGSGSSSRGCSCWKTSKAGVCTRTYPMEGAYLAGVFWFSNFSTLSLSLSWRRWNKKCRVYAQSYRMLKNYFLCVSEHLEEILPSLTPLGLLSAMSRRTWQYHRGCTRLNDMKTFDTCTVMQPILHFLRWIHSDADWQWNINCSIHVTNHIIDTYQF